MELKFHYLTKERTSEVKGITGVNVGRVASKSRILASTLLGEVEGVVATVHRAVGACLHIVLTFFLVVD